MGILKQKKMEIVNVEKPNKLSSEELEEFQKLIQEYQKGVFDLGNLEVDLDILHKQVTKIKENKENLLSHLINISQKQQEFRIRLGEKYGDAEVNIATGELSRPK